MVWRHRFPLTLLLTALILLPAAAISRPATSSFAKDDVLTHPYTLATLDSAAFHRIDPDTLADMPGEVWMGGFTYLTSPEILVSADGGTIAVIHYKNPSLVMRGRQVTVHILDARSGAQIASFHPHVAMTIGDISRDGSLLFGYGTTRPNRSEPWYAINARTGRVISHMLLLNGYDPLYDPATNQLYVLHTFPIDQQTHQPQTPVLSSYDLHGQLLGTVHLDGVLAGGGTDPSRQENGVPVMEMWSPGLALSPDGSQIAVLDGASDTLRLVDTHRMQVVKTETLSQPQSALTRLASLLGILPTTAEAKELEGVMLNMEYSPDGKSLYVTGTRGSFDASGKFSWQSLGLRRIDVQSGTVEATTLQGHGIWWSQLAPDGAAYYVLTPTAKDALNNDSCPCALERLDSQTLSVTASRTFQADPMTGSVPQFYILKAV